MSQIQDKLKRSIEAAESLYHRLVLLVGETGSGKTAVLRDVATVFGTSIVNINLDVSSELLELSPKQRPVQLPMVLGRIVEKGNSPLFLDNLEMLFDKDLKQDPLRLLQSISRNRMVIATWNGAFKGQKLSYAEYGHPEYRVYDSVDALIVSMDGNATIEPEIQ
jgi:DNA polymerase III delta prime subunit